MTPATSTTSTPSSTTTSAPSRSAPEALAHRLAEVRRVMGLGRSTTPSPDALFDDLTELVDAVRQHDDDSWAWLLVVGLMGAYPAPGLTRTVRRAISLKGSDDAVVWLLDTITDQAVERGNPLAELRVVTDRPLVDVTHTAGSGLLTGIQRTVRGVASQWSENHEVELVAWVDRAGAYRGLEPAERERLLQLEADAFTADRERTAADVREVIVPWGVEVVLLEVPGSTGSASLIDLGRLTGSSLRLVGYDCIPVASAEMVPLAEPEKFGSYLELVKSADRLAAISRTAASEFQGYVDSLATQGADGPSVVACPLPHTTAVSPDPGTREPDLPVVICIGTIGRRKNQVVLVEAAELLWREGLSFELRLFGHVGAERSPVMDLVRELRELGRPLVVESGASDERVAASLRHARCLVFPTLHEGFGLPVVEALSHGVPVVTSDFGSVREVAEGQGGLLVDPEDPAAVADAMRAILTDDTLRERLVGEALSRRERTWSHYAAELWEALLA